MFSPRRGAGGGGFHVDVFFFSLDVFLESLEGGGGGWGFAPLSQTQGISGFPINNINDDTPSHSSNPAQPPRQPQPTPASQIANNPPTPLGNLEVARRYLTYYLQCKQCNASNAMQASKNSHLHRLSRYLGW